MSRLDLLVIQEIPPKDRSSWRESVGLEAYNAIQLFMHFFPKTELEFVVTVMFFVGAFGSWYDDAKIAREDMVSCSFCNLFVR